MARDGQLAEAWRHLFAAGDALMKADGGDPTGDETDGTNQALAAPAPAAMTTNTQQNEIPPIPAQDDPRGLLFDPFALIDQLGYRDRATGLTYNTLREMAKRVPTVTGITQTRLTQVSAFSQRQTDLREPGFAIALRDHKAHPTRQDKIRQRQLEDWILGTGSRWHAGRDDFKTFLRKITRDALDLDQCCFEVVPNRKGVPAEFYAIDGATVRLADVPPSAESYQDPNQVKYVQVYDEIIITEWSAEELCFGVRNPRTDIRTNGYGFSELEMLINTITATLWAFEYNKRAFSQGTLVNGVMNFKGAVADRKVDAFRRQWKMMISGVGNSHRVPMTNVEELQWIDFQKNNRDMEYNAWMDFLIKVTCAVYQFDPAEINFVYGNTGQSSQMFQAPTEQKLQSSKDRGLRPLLKDIARWINIHLIWPIDPYMEFRFMGLDTKSSQEAIDQSKKESEFMKTVDELRAENDMDPLPNGKGEIILNTVWLQNAQAMDQMGGGMGGMPGEDGQQPGAPSDGTEMQQPHPPGLADLAAQGQDDGPELSSDDFAALFPEKSMQAKDELRKSDKKKARVRVYDIDL